MADNTVQEAGEREFLHQTVEKQYLNEAQIQFKLAVAGENALRIFEIL